MLDNQDHADRLSGTAQRETDLLNPILLDSSEAHRPQCLALWPNLTAVEHLPNFPDPLPFLTMARNKRVRAVLETTRFFPDRDSRRTKTGAVN